MFSAYHQKLTGDDVSWSEERDDKEESYSSYMVRRLSARGAREKAFRGGMSEMEAAALLRSFVFGNRMMWLFHEPEPGECEDFPLSERQIDLFWICCCSSELQGAAGRLPGREPGKKASAQAAFFE